MGLKCPSVHVRPQKVSSISMKFGMWVEADEWRYAIWRIQGQGHGGHKVEKSANFKFCLLY